MAGNKKGEIHAQIAQLFAVGGDQLTNGELTISAGDMEKVQNALNAFGEAPSGWVDDNVKPAKASKGILEQIKAELTETQANAEVGDPVFPDPYAKNYQEVSLMATQHGGPVTKTTKPYHLKKGNPKAVVHPAGTDPAHMQAGGLLYRFAGTHPIALIARCPCGCDNSRYLPLKPHTTAEDAWLLEGPSIDAPTFAEPIHFAEYHHTYYLMKGLWTKVCE